MSALVVTPYAVTSGYVIALGIFVFLAVTVLVAVRILDTRHQPKPRFDLTLEVDSADSDGVVIATGPTAELRVHAGLTNSGSTPAGRTTLYVLVPRDVNARWIGAQTVYEPELTAEWLPVGERRVDAWYLRGVLPRVEKGDNPVATLIVEATVPSEVPMRFRAVARDLANEDDATIDRLFVVR